MGKRDEPFPLLQIPQTVGAHALVPGTHATAHARDTESCSIARVLLGQSSERDTCTNLNVYWDISGSII
jgi:hypothetical protein